MSGDKVDEYYKRQAKDMTNMLFDKRLLSDDLSLETVNALQEYVGYVLQSTAEGAAKCALLTAKFKEKTPNGS